MPICIKRDNNPQDIFGKHWALKCPHCGVLSNISCVSVPRLEFLDRFRPTIVGVGYRCDSCNYPVLLRFRVDNYHVGSNRILLGDNYDQVERAQEDFEFNYLPPDIEADFREALICYSDGCFNAFGAMCRRTVQSVSMNLGAQGKDKVLHQSKDLKDMAQIDDESFSLLKQIVIDGHDAAHPHLPSLNEPRAVVLLE